MKKEINRILKKNFSIKRKITSFDELKTCLDQIKDDVLGKEESIIKAEEDYFVCNQVQFSLKDEKDFDHAYSLLKEEYGKDSPVFTTRRKIMELSFVRDNSFNYHKLLKLVKESTKDDLLIKPYSKDFGLQFDIYRRNGVLKDNTYVNLNCKDKKELYLSLYNLAQTMNQCSFREYENMKVMTA